MPDFKTPVKTWFASPSMVYTGKVMPFDTGLGDFVTKIEIKPHPNGSYVVYWKATTTDGIEISEKTVGRQEFPNKQALQEFKETFIKAFEDL